MVFNPLMSTAHGPSVLLTQTDFALSLSHDRKDQHFSGYFVISFQPDRLRRVQLDVHVVVALIETVTQIVAGQEDVFPPVFKELQCRSF